ncbi:hypothetical protein ABEV74_04715 [Paenibacillus cisolokensis]|jgi:hypothetical protein|uniref:Uncharacterized protein n=1 Tax=Paenibacillus cisolokensis TaxID=1658519 RepID=A0ABQ4N816_9BACL|nr:MULTISPECIES: hypothetical protein [Paenibacillus]ALS28287.1 hypothetical protein IJ21_28910 [Paenibacillus sp. 32O-W]GIQ64345.1 hypothetical protein PACILC2_29130 [Paenibacillus cisolokensis]
MSVLFPLLTVALFVIAGASLFVAMENDRRTRQWMRGGGARTIRTSFRTAQPEAAHTLRAAVKNAE